MKKVINGKRYDTAKAIKIGEWDNRLPIGDFRFEEVLYKTHRGNYFLFGHGGAYSQYAISMGNTVGGSSRIVPLTVEEAFEWASKHLDAEVVEQEFLSMIEDA